MDPEDNIPICDVFEGDEAFWTEKYTGPTASKVRGAAKGHETRASMPDEIKELTFKARSIASRRVWSEMGEEIIEAQNVGKSNMTIEAKQSRSLAMSISAHSVWDGYDFEDKNTRVSNQYRRSEGPNSPELFLGLYLLKRFPGEWVFNGQRQAGFVIAGKIPDYVNVNGKKAVAEVFGTFFHPEEDEETWKALYKSVGYECFIVWEYDVCNEEFLDKMFGVTV